MTIPNFFIIGAPKSGTTALSEYLREHPNVFFSTPKEPGYFDFALSKENRRSLKSYLALFSKSDPALHQTVGEASITYLFSGAAAGILRFNPHSRFLVMLRNPLELVPAWHSEMVYIGMEDILDFETAWRAENDRRKGDKIPRSCFEPKYLMYSEWGKLGDQMERLFAVVRRDRIKAVLFDDFAADTKKIYEEVLLFLGLPPDGRTDFPKINESRRIRWPWLQRSLAFASRRAARVKKKIGWSGSLGFLRGVFRLNSEAAARAPIPARLGSELRAYYQGDILKLSRLLGRDLSHWMSVPSDTTPELLFDQEGSKHHRIQPG